MHVRHALRPISLTATHDSTIESIPNVYSFIALEHSFAIRIPYLLLSIPITHNGHFAN